MYFRAYVANRFTDKLTKITDHIYCCRSGSAADTQAIADIVSYHLEFHESVLDLKEKLSRFYEIQIECSESSWKSLLW